MLCVLFVIYGGAVVRTNRVQCLGFTGKLPHSWLSIYGIMWSSNLSEFVPYGYCH